MVAWGWDYRGEGARSRQEERCVVQPGGMGRRPSSSSRSEGAPPDSGVRTLAEEGPPPLAIFWSRTTRIPPVAGICWSSTARGGDLPGTPRGAGALRRGCRSLICESGCGMTGYDFIRTVRQAGPAPPPGELRLGSHQLPLRRAGRRRRLTPVVLRPLREELDVQGGAGGRLDLRRNGGTGGSRRLRRCGRRGLGGGPAERPGLPHRKSRIFGTVIECSSGRRGALSVPGDPGVAGTAVERKTMTHGQRARRIPRASVSPRRFPYSQVIRR
jgi:hypothetical protein